MTASESEPDENGVITVTRANGTVYRVDAHGWIVPEDEEQALQFIGGARRKAEQLRSEAEELRRQAAECDLEANRQERRVVELTKFLFDERGKNECLQQH